ncbi:hypothetical protein PaG_00739 [Moesziomyces aphidis]|uniref:G-patch domain-containing protein n=1 Tax=Moesziomyces aphidis TaxID=84754 RepID=W3VT44_MOEAP|nr:hypothetical protein PaG_00739 [Moesziomyces aphidis]
MSHGSTPQHGQTLQRATHYVDRDDPGPTFDRSGSCRGAERRRSRSPGAPAHSGSSVPWADQRLPRADAAPPAKPPATSKGASVKPSIPRPAATAATKRMATDITKWNRKQAELHQLPASSPATAAVSDSAEAGPSSERMSSAAEMSSEALARYDYKDLGRIACLLCQRKFKSADTLHRHESESQLHRDNLASADTCRQGVARKLEALASLTSPADNATAVTAACSAPTQYRDRASERRAVFGTEAPPPSAASGAGKAFDAPKTAGGETVRSAPERPVGEENVGSKLLKMMGWTQGEGLGKGRQGTTEIVQTKVYRPGAGLGSAAPVPTAERPGGAESIATSSRGSVTFQGYAHRARDRK